MTEDWRDRPSRRRPDDNATPPQRSGHPEWPSPTGTHGEDATPTDVYAALSDLAPHDPGRGEPVPRDFAPPPDAVGPADTGVGASRVRLTPLPAADHPRDFSDSADFRPPANRPRASFIGDEPFLGDEPRPDDRPGTGVAWFGSPGAPSEVPGTAADRHDRPPAEDPAQTYGRLAGGDPAQTYGHQSYEGFAGGEPPRAPGRFAAGRDPAETYGRWAADEPAEAYGRGAADEPAEAYGRWAADGPAETYGSPVDDPAGMHGHRVTPGREGSGAFDRVDDDPASLYRRPGDGATGMFDRAGGDATEVFDRAGDGATEVFDRAGGDRAGMYRRPPASGGDPTEIFDRPWAPAEGGAAGVRGLAADGEPSDEPYGAGAAHAGAGVGYAGAEDGYPGADHDDAYGRRGAAHLGADEAFPDPAGGGHPGAGDRAGRHEGPARVEWVRAADETVAGDGPLIDLSVPRAAPVTHRGRSRRRRTVVVVAALGAVLAGGTGYAGLRAFGLHDGSTRKNAEVPLVTIAPTTGPSLPDDSPSVGVLPSSAASARKSASASPSASASSSAPTTPPATPSRAPASSGTVVIPAAPTPTQINSPHVVKPAPPTTTAAPVTARFSQVGNGDGFAGTVTVTNPGNAAADWTVTMTARGADHAAVVNGGVTVRLDGDQLTFTGPAIAAGGSLTYTFAVSGSLTGPLSGCAVNGSACS